MEDSVLRQSGSWSLTANQLENIRKGFMVSRIQTTMRNMRSAIIRSPLVGMDNVFQAGIRRYSDPNIGGKLNTAPKQELQLETVVYILQVVRLTPCIKMEHGRVLLGDYTTCIKNLL